MSFSTFQEAKVEGLFEPNAPEYDQNDQGLLNLTYDQVIEWWNSLRKEERSLMKSQRPALLEGKYLQKFRKEYAAYYPKEYFPKKLYANNEVSASDFYALYYCCDQLRQKYPDWFTADVYQAFQVAPPAYDDLPNPPSYEEATQWWNNLSKHNQQVYLNQASNMQSSQVNQIRIQYAPYHRCYRLNYASNIALNNALDFYDFYLMTRYSNRLRYLFLSPRDYLFYDSIRASIQLTGFVARGAAQVVQFGVHGTVHATRAMGGFMGTVGNNISGTKADKDTAAILLGLAVIVGVIVTACSALVSSVYAGVKSLSSLSNLVQGKKIGRSLWRLACVAGGGFLGATKGLIAGAIVGSAIPGIGNVAGAIMGACFGGAIGCGLGAGLGKYSAQLCAWYFNNDQPNVVSATNPEKWDVNKIERVLADNHVQMNTNEIVTMLTTLKQTKSQYKSISGGFANTQDNNEKKKYNKFLEAIKMGKDPRNFVRIDERTCLMWNKTHNSIEKQDNNPIVLPVGLAI